MDLCSINACESTRNADKLLSQYHDQLNILLDAVTLKPSEVIQNGLAKYISIDPFCNSKLKTKMSCAQCSSLNRLRDKKSSTFNIETGRYVGITLHIHNHGSVVPSIIKDDLVEIRGFKLLKAMPGLLECGTPELTNLTFLACDSFTNNLIASMLIFNVLRRQGLTHSIRTHTAYICAGEGFTLEEQPTWTLNQLTEQVDFLTTYNGPKAQSETNEAFKPDVAQSIILQLIVSLVALRSITFVHGNASPAALKFSRGAIGYSYDNLRVEGSFNLKLDDFTHTSVTAGKVRIFPSTPLGNQYVSKSAFTPKLKTISSKLSGCGKSDTGVCSTEDFSFFILDQDTKELLTYIRSSGIPLFAGSLDLYAFFVSLMTCRVFYNSVMHNDNLRAYWSVLWLPGDEEKAEDRIKLWHHGVVPTSNDIMEILRGLNLRCNMLDLMWSYIRM